MRGKRREDEERRKNRGRKASIEVILLYMSHTQHHHIIHSEKKSTIPCGDRYATEMYREVWVYMPEKCMGNDFLALKK